MVSDPSLLLTFIPSVVDHAVYLTDRLHVLRTIGHGTIPMTVSNPPQPFTQIVLSNVLVSPSISTNIISIRKLCAENNLAVLLTTSFAYVYRYGSRANRAYTTASKMIFPSLTSLPLSNVSPPYSQTASPKENMTPKEFNINDTAPPKDHCSPDMTFLFSLSNIQELYSFKINIRSFPNMIAYSTSLTVINRDPDHPSC